MRYPRNKVIGKGCYYHVSNHICGERGSLPFKSEDKEYGIEVLKLLEELYFSEIVSYCWMGNHFHIVVYFPGQTPPLEEVVKRYNHFYKDDPHHYPPLNPEKDLERCQMVARKLIDLSEFMRSFQQRFTCWFNKKQCREGPLWKSRFWSCILEGPTALWECVKYVELNPVRAEIADTPEDYAFCSWSGIKDHPFKASFVKHMSYNSGFRNITGDLSKAEKIVFKLFQKELEDILFCEQRLTKQQIEKIYDEAKRNNKGLFEKFLIRVKDWSRGMIVGSGSYVEATALEFYQTDNVIKKEKRFGRNSNGIRICSYHKGHPYTSG